MRNLAIHKFSEKRLSFKTSTTMKPVSTISDDSMYAQGLNPQIIEKESNDMLTKTLSNKDPQHPKNIMTYSYEENCWKTDERDPENLTILKLENSILHKEDKALTTYQNNYHTKRINAKKKAKALRGDYGGDEADAMRSMRNQLTFAERTSQTFNPSILVKKIETVKLPRNNHSGVIHKWDIFDKYLLKFVADEEKRKQDQDNKMGNLRKERVKKVEKQIESLQKPSLLKTLKLVERQIMQILNSEKYLLYREWNGSNDEVSDSKQLLNLLPFPQSANIKNRSVTAICWNPKYEDLFAVGYGSYAFPRKKEDLEKADGEERGDDILENGSIYVFSVKNNYYPEIKYSTVSGVLCLDFHQKQFSYLVAGMYDGTVSVYDIKQKIKTPIICCDIRLQRHMDPVWQVKWYMISEVNELIFYSISSDGRVVKWSFLKNKTKLESEEIITLKYIDSANEVNEKAANSNADSNSDTKTATYLSTLDQEKEKADEVFISGNSGGMCLDFNRHKQFEHYFVLGTEEGHIHLCSVNHRGHFIQSYEGHSMGVYTVSWNPFHEKVFLSCSADWTIKVWHYKVFQPLIIFDMQNPVGDVAWSPWCSTIFAAVTAQGNNKFFDINRNRKGAVNDGKKYQDIPINHIAFNKYEYVYLTGNDKGKVRLWKMAQVLRTTIDKKEEEEKEKAKNQATSQKANVVETKIHIPKNLIQAASKQKKVVEIKKDNKLETVSSEAFTKNEKERINEFLILLGVDKNL